MLNTFVAALGFFQRAQTMDGVFGLDLTLVGFSNTKTCSLSGQFHNVIHSPRVQTFPKLKPIYMAHITQLLADLF